MLGPRKESVDFVKDDYSLSNKHWALYRSDSASKPHRSLIREQSGYFDYFDVNNSGKTPLMTSVELNYIKKTFNILLYGADPNIQHQTTGNTALHMAVDNGNIILVKLLLLFDADTTIRNHQNLQPLDIAELIKQKISGLPSIKVALKFTALPLAQPPTHHTIKDESLNGDIDGIIEILKEANHLQYKSKEYFENNATMPSPRNSSGKYLLSLDGGGVRVFNVLQAMVNIEKRMKQLTLKSTQKLYSYFDYIGGTSCGGLAACLLAYNSTDALNGRAITLRGMLDVLATPISERGDRLDTILKEIFGEERTMSDIEPNNPQAIITAALAEYTPYDLHLMTSYGKPRDGQAGPVERKVWEACRITSSAPSYFPVLRDLKLLDGGLVCNNPTLDCMSDIIKQGENGEHSIKLDCVVSIGTGHAPKQECQEVEFFTTSALSFLSTKNIQALKNLIQHFLSHTTLSDGREVINAQSLCKGLKCEYFRLTPAMKEEVSLDTAKEEKIIDMLFNTQMYYLNNPELIDNVAKCLLSK